jgi:hypothetical protein
MAGFVSAAGMAQGGAAAATPAAAPVVVDVAGDDGEAQVAAGARPPMRWNNNTSGFVLRRMAQIIGDGSRTDKFFKDKDVNTVAKALHEYSGEVVSPTQVYNHLRKWRQKWGKVAKLKELSGALFDDTTNAIMLDTEHYLGHCKVETKVFHTIPIHSLLYFLVY